MARKISHKGSSAQGNKHGQLQGEFGVGNTQVTTARKVLSETHPAVWKAVSWDRRQLVAEICNKEHTV